MRKLSYVLLNGLFAMAVIAGFGYDVTWAANIAKFVIWVMFLAAVLVTFVDAKLPKRYEPPVPLQVDLAYDFAIVLILAGLGHSLYASLYLLHMVLFHTYLFRNNPR